MKLAVLTTSLILLLTLVSSAEASEKAESQRAVASKKETLEKVNHLDKLRSKLQGYKGSVRI